MNRFAGLVAAVAISIPMFQAHGQNAKSRSAGFFIGAGLEGNAITQNESGSVTESGGGAGLVLGYGFTRRWSLYTQFSGAVINADGGGDYTLAHFDLGTRIHFRTGPNIVVPFLQVALSGRAIEDDVNGTSVNASGGGVSFGGGLNAHFTPAVAFSAAFVWSVGSFENFRVGNQSIATSSVDATSGRFHLGLVWFPKS